MYNKNKRKKKEVICPHNFLILSLISTASPSVLIMTAAILFLYALSFIALLSTTSSFKVRTILSARSSSATTLSMTENSLDTGDYDGKFFKVSGVIGASADIESYRLEATIKSKELNSFLEEYKGEMKRRRVIFPGFRPGVLPPYAMGDVRKYIVSFGLETTLGNLVSIQIPLRSLNDLRLSFFLKGTSVI